MNSGRGFWRGQFEGKNRALELSIRDASHTGLTILPLYGAEIEMSCHGECLNMRARGDLFIDPSHQTNPANPVGPVIKMVFDGIDWNRGQDSAYSAPL